MTNENKAVKNGTRSAFGHIGVGGDFSCHSPGLTKREYIAIQAMAALIQKETDMVRAYSIADIPDDPGIDRKSFFATITAKAAVIYADALLLELEKPHITLYETADPQTTINSHNQP